MTVKQVSFSGFDAPGACTMTAVVRTNIFGQMAVPGGRRGGPAPAAAAAVHAEARPGGAVRAVDDDSRQRAVRPSRTGTARARPAATRSTRMRRSGCRIGRRRSASQVTLTIGSGADADRRRRFEAVQYRYEGNIFSGEKRSELLVVPAASVARVARDRHHPVSVRCRAARPTDNGVGARAPRVPPGARSASPWSTTRKGASREHGATSSCRRAGPSTSAAGRGEVHARGRDADGALRGAAARRRQRPASTTSRRWSLRAAHRSIAATR